MRYLKTVKSYSNSFLNVALSGGAVVVFFSAIFDGSVAILSNGGGVGAFLNKNCAAEWNVGSAGRVVAPMFEVIVVVWPSVEAGVSFLTDDDLKNIIKTVSWPALVKPNWLNF